MTATAYAPESLPEALDLLAEDPARRPLAGCTDLMVASPEERRALGETIDLLRLPELRGIREAGDGAIEIGAAVPFSEIRRTTLLQERFPSLVAAAGVVGGWQIQNRGTMGGNAVNASPAGDSLPALLALEAGVVLARRSGDRTEEREVPYREFHRGYRRTALEAGELVVRFRLPRPPEGSVQVFRKVGTRQAQAISKVVLALLARLREGRFDHFRLAAGSVAPTPIRFPELEQAMLGRAPDEATAELAGRLAAEAVEPIDDVRSTASYRRAVLRRLVRRVVLDLGAGAG